MYGDGGYDEVWNGDKAARAKKKSSNDGFYISSLPRPTCLTGMPRTTGVFYVAAPLHPHATGDPGGFSAPRLVGRILRCLSLITLVWEFSTALCQRLLIQVGRNNVVFSMSQKVQEIPIFIAGDVVLVPMRSLLRLWYEGS